MRFALFFLAEYAGMITTSAVCVALFFGGWHLPWLDKIPALHALAGNVDPAHPELTTSIIACVVRSVVFFTKTIGIIFIFMWVRWSLPRFRFDQLMQLAWRALIPISLAIVLMTALVVFVGGSQNDAYKAQQRVDGSMAAAMFLANVILMAIIMIASRILPAAPTPTAAWTSPTPASPPPRCRPSTSTPSNCHGIRATP